jgi:protein involved in polysaccharide export with SLBB domain
MNILSSPGAQRWRLVLTLILATACLSSCGLFRWDPDIDDDPHRRRVESLGDFRIGAGTVVFVEMFEGGESTMRADLVVDPTGNLIVPKVGEVSVEGMAPLEASKKIEFLARRSGQSHLSGPRIHVNALDRRAVVHVSGNVNQSGPVTFTPGLTVAEAIEAAGGPTADANARSVSLTNEGRKKIVATPESYELREGDVVNVPRRL